MWIGLLDFSKANLKSFDTWNVNGILLATSTSYESNVEGNTKL